jgi:hypothetical protein
MLVEENVPVAVQYRIIQRAQSSRHYEEASNSRVQQKVVEEEL